MNTGYPVGNFSISASVTPAGRLFGDLQQNPGKLGLHLARVPGGNLCFSRAEFSQRIHQMPHRGIGLRDEEFAVKRVERQWPVSTLELCDDRLGALMISVTAFAPLASKDHGKISALPALFARVRIHNRGEEAVEDLELSWRPALPLTSDWAMGWFVNGQGKEDMVHVMPGKVEERWLVIAHHDPERMLDVRFGSSAELLWHVAGRGNELLEATRQLARELPFSGDPVLDQALRWNATAAVLLTRCTCRGEIITLGYKELNQRDSYWTSFLHALLWPELDRKMIEQSIAAQRPNGKIPTCILPEIEREVDIDINAYFVLRISRHLALYPDAALSEAWWPAVEKAMAFLATLDDEGIGLPYQRTFWGDWKDVPGVEKRTYSPHACLMVCAALQQTVVLAEQLDKTAEAKMFREQLEKALRQINLPFSDGGLWNGRFYQQRWSDGRDDGVLLEDQVVAGLFGVIPPERLDSICDALNEFASGPFGVSETWPWYPESYGYTPGHYHNGGVWPWLSYADGWCRMAAGRLEEGIQILKRVAWADLERMQDYQPNEYLSAVNGENCGPPIQGWTASYVGAIAWGMKGKPVPALTTSTPTSGTSDEF